LGCRFATSFRALADVGRLRPGEWAAVHGCGGVGLSAILIAKALGARVAAVDLRPEALDRARALGAEVAVDAAREKDVAQALRDATGGGAHVSMDALGHPDTCFQSVACLRKRGRHVQVGLLLAEQSRPRLPMDRVIADELEILGSHGMPARSYPAMLERILAGKLEPGKLIGRRISLEEAAEALPAMDVNPGPGVTVIDRF
jgi:alcohol dehydrogenase